MSISDYISKQLPERQKILNEMHEIILQTDTGVIVEIAPMMGKDMIIYKARGIFKYGLSGVKNYLSFHAMPIYASPTLHSKYKQLLLNANFQKGCINFKSAADMPLDVFKELMNDCSKIDLQKIREDYLKSKKSKSQ